MARTGVDLVDEDCPLLAAVAQQVALAVAVDVQAPHHAAALDPFLPDRGPDRPSIPADLSGQATLTESSLPTATSVRSG
jgi:hypothetical protein